MLNEAGIDATPFFVCSDACCASGDGGLSLADVGGVVAAVLSVLFPVSEDVDAIADLSKADDSVV